MQAALLAIAFSQSIDADIFRRYLLRQITDYLRSTCKMRDSCAVVVALASDAEGSDSCDHDGEDPAWSSADDPASGDVRAAEQHHGGAAPSGRHTAEGLSSSEARAARQAAAPRRQTASGTFEHERHMPIVGTSMVSFDTRSRNKSLTLNPPDDQPFLTNMAVCQDYQRRGVATQLLHACEAHALRKWRRPCTMYLSARIKDEPAVRLYLCDSLRARCLCTVIAPVDPASVRMISCYRVAPALRPARSVSKWVCRCAGKKGTK